MKDRTADQIKAERKLAIQNVEALLGDSADAIDSYIEDAPPDAKPLWFLGKSLEWLSTADCQTANYNRV